MNHESKNGFTISAKVKIFNNKYEKKYLDLAQLFKPGRIQW